MEAPIDNRSSHRRSLGPKLGGKGLVSLPCDQILKLGLLRVVAGRFEESRDVCGAQRLDAVFGHSGSERPGGHLDAESSASAE